MARPAVLVLALAAGCAGGATEASPALVDQEVRRLLLPFQMARGVVCDELYIEITANFNEMVSHPAVDAESQRMTRLLGDGYVEYQWVNVIDRPQNHFLFRIVGTEDHQVATNDFAALRSARLRVYEGGHELTFRVTAEGEVTVAEAGLQRELPEYRIDDGRVDRD